MTVAGGFLTHLVSFGLVYSFSVFFPAILDEFGRGRGAVAWIGSIAAAFMLGSSGLSGMLADRFGPPRVMSAGAVLLGIGLVSAAAAPTIWLIYLSYGLIVGLGASMTFIPAIGAVGQWFERRRGLAIGITVAGSGIGTLIMAPLAEALIDGYGWRVAMRTIGLGGAALLLLAAALTRGRPTQRVSRGVRDLVRGSRTFKLMFASSVIAAYGYWVPFVHIVPYAEDHGITTTRAALLVAVMGIGNTVGRLVLGALADRVGRLRMMQAATVAMTVAIFAWPAATTWSTLAAFGFGYGLFAGAFISMLPALAADYFGMERLAGVTGLLFSAAALGTLLGAPMSGLMFDASGSYSLAIVVGGVTMAVGAALIMPLPRPEPRA